VEDYLSEREQVDRIRQWWKENGAWIIIGLGGGLLAIAGWNWWQNYQQERATQASALYSVVAEAAMEDRVDEVRLGVERLAAGHAGSPYLQHARMALAAASVRSGDMDAAIAELEQVLADAADAQLRQVARLRLARVVLATGDSDRALELARGADDGAFAAALLEIEGDALAARGEDTAAREAYQQAIAAAQGTPGIIDEAFVQLKLEALAPGVAGDAEAGGETS